MTEEEKISAICSCVLNSYNLGQPILIGTVSIEKSELLSFALKKLKVKHEVLNAKHHMNEAYIIAQAGQLKSVTIATNMAGRGTDIILGGDSEFMARNEVSKKINQKNSILVKFGFLTGNPKLIDINALARKDFDNINYLINMKESTEIKKKILKNSLKYNKKISLNNLMHFDSNTKSEFFESRISFYKNSVNSYSKALIKFNKICEFNREKVLKVGGLKVIGTERHESRRIDNQLRGRAGRQGDPGETCFYLSLEDDLMRIFGSKKMFNLMHKFGIKKNIPIKHPWISKSIENAQKRVEGFNFDSRKELIEYDDVINKQRSTIYTLRNKILFEKNISELILDLIEDYIINLTSNIMNNKKLNFKIKYEQLEKKIFKFLNIEIKLNKFNGDLNDLMDYFFVIIKNKYFDKKKNADKELILKFEKMIYLESVDENWKTHLQNMDYLREGIHFRGYAQKDPRQEYKKEGYILFSRMRAKIRNEVISKIFKAKRDNEIQKRINEYFIEFEKFKKMNNLNHNLEIEKIEKANEKNFSKKKKSSEKIIKFNREQRRKIVSKNKKKKKNICV
jgi:preprotein translocase subunit SecA